MIFRCKLGDEFFRKDEIMYIPGFTKRSGYFCVNGYGISLGVESSKLGVLYGWFGCREFTWLKNDYDVFLTYVFDWNQGCAQFLLEPMYEAALFCRIDFDFIIGQYRVVRLVGGKDNKVYAWKDLLLPSQVAKLLMLSDLY